MIPWSRPQVDSGFLRSSVTFIPHDASGKVCTSCDSGTVWATANDTENLANNWTQISGSILGSGTNSAGVMRSLEMFWPERHAR
jgi:hypothetical protein